MSIGNFKTLQITTDILTYHKKSNSFSQEASTLGLGPGYWPHVIEITNPKTKISKRFLFVKYNVDRENEVTHASYKCDNINLTIWND